MIYFQNIKSINDIPFTSREIDVISCIINIRGTKKIAVILDISPRTVEGHIQNILLKTSLNSQERIKDFIENSNELLLIKQRYLDLIITSAFEEQIKKLSHLFSRVKKSCVIDYEENEILEYIIKYLKLSSVEVVLKTDNELTNLGNECILRILSQDNRVCHKVCLIGFSSTHAYRSAAIFFIKTYDFYFFEEKGKILP
ncbi:MULTISPECIES: helix-turn-helix transcriptional regulator [unclassified Candidatus Tisiphia]|uniref:helix-turn-helix transcriptional regulator n=1 Tax=unclassified Candidatus Tisiphia TaxID=2996318 RepID=UPI00312CAC22